MIERIDIEPGVHCVHDGCTALASWAVLSGMAGEIPVTELVCDSHRDTNPKEQATG